MSDLTVADFLAARLDEDAALAEAATPGPWKSYIEGRDHWGGDSFIETGGEDLYPYVQVGGSEYNPKYAEDRDHIARHDPARVLREVEAGRKILERWKYLKRHDAPGNPDPDEFEDYVLRPLAAVYSDHPDYETWKP